MPTFTWGRPKSPGPGEILCLTNRQGSDLTTGFMFTCPTDLVALPGFRKGDVFFLWDQNWWDFFLNKVDTFFMFFSCCFSVVVLLCSPQWLGSFFLGCVWEGVLFVTFWMIQTPCVSSKKTTGGNARHPFQRRIRTISNGSDLCIPSGVGELSANEAMKPSQQNSKMDDDWCMMYIYIYLHPPGN